MSDREYTITIKSDGDSGSKSPIAGDNKESDTWKGKGFLKTKESRETFAKGLVAWHTVKSFATQIANHEVSMVELRTGSKELQERANFINETVQKGVGVLESIAVGAAMGGWVGALAGLALSSAHLAITYAQRQDTINTQRSLENTSIQMNYIRAGANGSRSKYE